MGRTSRWIFFFALIFGLRAQALPTAPEAVPGGYQSGAQLRVFMDREDFTLVGEALYINETAGRELQDFSFGSYYHFSPAFKMGLFFTRDYGLRHDEDWALTNGKWSWNISNDRGENLVAVDATWKTLLDFLPGENWVAELKSRYIYNSFNDNRTLLLRPGLTYFYLQSGHLVADFFVQLELDFPLNYGVQPVDEHWIYLGSLYHFTHVFDAGPFVNLGWQTWGASHNYMEKGGAPYAITTQTTTLGLTAILRL
jgi:hypothetical protein